MEKEAKQLLQEGLKLAKAGAVSDAIQRLMQVVSVHPGSSVADNAHYNLGMLHLKNHDDEKAWAHFKIVVDQYPDSDAAEFAQDQLDELKHKVDPSADTFDAAQKAYIKGDLKTAKRLYEELVTHHPDSGLADNAHFALGMLGRRMGDLVSADRHFAVVRTKYADSDAARLLKELEKKGR